MTAEGTPPALPRRGGRVRGLDPSFARWLALPLVLGLVARVVYTVVAAPWPPPGFDDESFYFLQAQAIAHGQGFIDPASALYGHVVASAAHPPLYPLLLAGIYKVGLHSDVAARLAGAVTGTGTVLMVALIARRLAGNRVGLIAAWIAALYPVLITADGAMMSESLFGLFVAISIWAALRVADAPSNGGAVLCGAALGLASLTRGDALVLLVLLLLFGPIAFRRGRWRAPLVVLVSALVVMAPWTIRNAEVFHRPVLLSTDLASAVAGANCPGSYYGHGIGDWDLMCIQRGSGNEAVSYDHAESVALRYARSHIMRVPVVVAARLLRLAGVRTGFPFGTRLLHVEGRNDEVLAVGLVMYLVLLVLAARGLALLRGRGPMWIIVAPLVSVCIIAAAFYGSLRFRQSAELSLVVLSAFTIDELWSRRRHTSYSAGVFRRSG